MGMLKEGVRLDRVRGGRQKYRGRIRYHQDFYGREQPPTPSLEGLCSSFCRLDLEKALTSNFWQKKCLEEQRVLFASEKRQLLLKHCEIFEGLLKDALFMKVYNLFLAENEVLNALKKCEPPRESADKCPPSKNSCLLNMITDSHLREDTHQSMSHVAAFYEKELVSTITWAKQVPGNDHNQLLLPSKPLQIFSVDFHDLQGH